MHQQPGAFRLEARFDRPRGARVDVTEWGWPLPLLTRIQAPVYEDAATRQGKVQSRTDQNARRLGYNEFPPDPAAPPPRPLWQWQGGSLLYQPAPEASGFTYTTYRANPGALTVPLALLLMLWLLLLIVGAAVNTAARRRIVTAFPRRTAIALAALAILAASLFAPEHIPGRMHASGGQPTQIGPPGPIYFVDPTMLRLDVDAQSLESAEPTAETDRILALKLLQAAPQQPAAEDQFLFAVWICETQLDGSTTFLASDRFPLYSLDRIRYIRRPDFGDPVHMLPAGRFFATWSYQLSLGISARDTTRPVIWLNIFPGPASTLIIAAWLLGLLVAFPMWLLQRRTAKRRRAAGACLHCGYQIASAP